MSSAEVDSYQNYDAETPPAAAGGSTHVPISDGIN